MNVVVKECCMAATDHYTVEGGEGTFGICDLETWSKTEPYTSSFNQVC